MGERPYPCTVCEKAFSNKSNRERHEKLHDLSRKKDTCHICGKEFKFLHLKNHIKRKHKGLGNMEKCLFCEKIFTEKRTCIFHMRCKHFDLLRKQDKEMGGLHSVFLGLRTYECYKCEYSSQTIPRIKKHLKKCKGIYKPFRCYFCEMRYSFPNYLQIHLEKVHPIEEAQRKRGENAEKLFECIDCKSTFITHSEFMVHIKCLCKKRPFKFE